MNQIKHLPRPIAPALSALFIAVLAACGGGGAPSGESAVSSADPSASAESTPSDNMQDALGTRWTTIASEGSTFTVAASTSVRYGSGASWIVKTVSGIGTCSNEFFGTDPAYGVGKYCQTSGTSAPAPAPAPAPSPSPAPAPAPAPTGSWTKVADEGGTFSVKGTNTVRFGSGSKWIQKVVTGSAQCSIGFFGSDPAYSVFKECDVSTAAPAPAPAPTPAPAPAPTPAPAPAPAPTPAPAPAPTPAPAPAPTPAPAPAPTPAPAPAPSSGVIKAVLNAARTSGTAPLAVHFEATQTTSGISGTDTFRQINYAYDFGDERGQKWAVSGLAKNTQTGGPIAAHVFDVPGTYVVKLHASDSAGNTADTSVTITVADPNAVYAGAKTVCVSVTSDFSGCPSGATQQSKLPTGTGWNGKRVLLHAGQDLSSLGKVDIQDGNAGVQVSSFGTGAKPVVQSVGVGDWRPATTNFANDVTIMGLQSKGGMNQNVGKRVLFYKNDLTGNGFAFGDVSGWGLYDDQYRQTPKSAYYNPTELFFVENTVTGTLSIGYNAFGWGARMGWMGNDFGTAQYHNLRVTQSYMSFFGHNRLRGISSTGGYHAMKLHAGGQTNTGLTPYNDNEVTSGGGWASQYNVIANNEFSSAQDNNGWVMMVSPENDAYPEGIQDAIIENNRVIVHGGQTDILPTGRRMTVRGTIRNDSSKAQIVTGQHGAALPAAWQGPYYIQ